MHQGRHEGFTQVKEKRFLDDTGDENSRCGKDSRSENRYDTIEGRGRQGEIGQPALGDDAAGHQHDHQESAHHQSGYPPPDADQVKPGDQDQGSAHKPPGRQARGEPCGV